MNTEITVNKATTDKGVVFYDDACGFCIAWVHRFGPALSRRGFSFAPLEGERTEMRVRLSGGQTLGGADAIVALAGRIWWAWPLWLLAHLPGAMPMLRAGYRFIAKRRHCINGVCAIRKRSTWTDWLPLIVLPAFALLAMNALPPWVFMWVLAVAVFLGCKWLVWRRAGATVRSASTLRKLGYWLAWPGMDVAAFLVGRTTVKPSSLAWIVALLKTTLGVALIWLVAKNVFAPPGIVTGWIGMIGVVLVLHFGTFHLLALFWQNNGVPAKPLMRAPLLATSLSDFWGSRWNTAFNALAHDLAFRPLARRFGIAGAMFGTFLISGVVHDFVISVPARGGFGLPTAYFALQGAGVLLERSRFGRALGLGKGWRGWLFVLLVTAAPAYWLFHPTFIHNVILPMLEAIGATLNSL